MNTYLFASVENTWLLAGWTMLHFLWLGTLVALAALPARWLLRRASANLRYVTALACLATLAALPVAIAAWLHGYSPSVRAIASTMRTNDTSLIATTGQVPATDLKRIEPIELNPPLSTQNSETHSIAQPAPLPAQSTDTTIAVPTATDAFALAVVAINASVHYLPWLWLIGTPITFALTATGLLGTRRLRRASRPITDGPLIETLEKLAASLRLTRRVAVVVCDRIASPVLIGILRPIILLPPAALTGYTADEIEMVLLHELAHVRRWDNLVNLMQRLVESILFFHPAVWLISSWVRRERENCCDALVVTRTDRPHAYAELLVAFAAQMPRSVLFHPAASSAMAAGPLRSRIRRILKLDDDPMLISGKSFALMVVALLAAALLAVVYLPNIGQAEQSQAKAKENTDATMPVEKTVRDTEKAERLETRGKSQKRLLELQGEIKRKYEDYLDIAKGMGRQQSNDQDPEIDLLLRDIADIQSKIQTLTTGLYQLQTDYIIAKAELSDPALIEAQAEEALKQDSQYADLLEKAKAQAAPSDGSEYLAVEKYRADFKKKAVREMHSKPNVALQQLTQRFRTNAGSMQKQIALLTEKLEQKRKELEKRVEKSVDLETRGEELKKLQQVANDIDVVQESLDIDVEAQTKNNLKNQMLALLNYEAARKSFPANAIYSPEGKPLLSWRVAILPFIDPKLYDEFRRDEPWDSEHNRKLIARMPDIFKNPKLDQPGKTNYLAVVGDECFMTGTPKKLGIKHMTDGTSLTISLVEADLNQAVEWTRPLDWKFDRDRPTQGLGKVWDNYWYHIRVDGSLHRIDNSEPADRIGIHFTRTGGESKSLAESANRTATEFSGVEGGPADVIDSALAGGPEPAPGEAAEVSQTAVSEGPTLAITGSVDAETELLLREITDIQKKKRELEGQLYQSQTDYLVAKSRLDEPQLDKTKNTALEKQQFEKEHKIRFAALQQQFANTQKSLEERLKTLKGRNEKSVEVQSRDTISNKVSSSTKNAKFPSLEEQKLADVVWKRLQIEVEPLSDEELNRVKTLGYAGGLRVIDFDRANNSGVMQGQFTEGDILVGLHVWPTKNMKEVAEILSRTDLSELNPLKFYVVHTTEVAGDEIAGRPKLVDQVATGRISVKLPESGFGTGGLFPSRSDYFDKSTSESPPKLQIYFFYSPTSEPSVKARTTVQQVVKQFSGVKLDESDVSRESEKAKHFVIDKVPTCLIVRDGQVVRRIVGLQDEKELHKEINDAISMPSNAPIDSSKASQVASADKPQIKTARSPKPVVGAPSIKAAMPKHDAKSAAPVVTGIVPNTEYVKLSDGQVGFAGGRGEVSLTPAESVFVAYDIPSELKNKALQYFRKSEVRSMADDRGRHIVQAKQTWHDNFAALLKATPKWHDPAAAKERVAAPVVMKKVDGEDILEWRSVGITLKLIRDNRLLLKSTGVGVTEVSPGSPAAWADIRLGDVLSEVGNFNAGTILEVQSLLKALGEGLQSKKTVSVTFFRPNRGNHIRADFALGPEDLGGKPAEPQDSKPPVGTKTSPAPANKAHFRYDGAFFDSWRTAWQSELSTEKRVEAVKALAAFGANGLGREAAEAILDVADQYEWVTAIRPDGVRSREPEGKLQKAVFAALVGGPGAVRIDTKYWLPLVRQRYDADPAKWQQFAVQILPNCAPANEKEKADIEAFLLLLAQCQDEAISETAIDGLVAHFPGSYELRKQLSEQFKKKDRWLSAVKAFGRTREFPPEVVDVLLHGDPEKQTALRKLFYLQMPPGDARWALVAKLTDMLKDDANAADHLATIRALGALARNDKVADTRAQDVLKGIADKGPREHQVAAACALQLMTMGKTQAVPVLGGNIRTAPGEFLSNAQLQTLVSKEQETVIGRVP